MNEKRKSNWGKGIVLLYGSFVVFILSIVLFAAFQDFHLVDQNYYEKEIAYQDHIDMVNRTNDLNTQLTVQQYIEINALTINFPDSIESNRISGEILFFRPSNATMDRSIKIKPNSKNQQSINLSDFSKGRWHMMIYWTVDSVSYFNQEEIFLP